MLNTSLSLQGQRSLSDLLAAERSLRSTSENTVRELRQILMEISIRLDGERMEYLRREDPQSPGNWSVSQWREFLKNIPVAGNWGATSKPSPALTDDSRYREMVKDIQTLSKELEKTRRQLESAEAERVRLSGVLSTAAGHGDTAEDGGGSEIISVSVPEGAIAPMPLIIENARKQLASYPKKTPLELSKAIDAGGRAGGDLQKIYQRFWLILYLIGSQRLCTAMEIDEALAQPFSVSSGAGSLKRVLDDMVEARVIESETLSVETPKTALKMVRLSVLGQNLYKELFGKQSVEGDWMRLIRLQDADKQKSYTLSVGLFALHARKRGYYTRVLPEAGSGLGADIWIGRGDESLFVSVDLEGKDRSTSRWENLAILNNGCVALCAGTVRARELLVSDCKLANIKPGIATDLETLISSGKYKQISSQKPPLWSEDWK